MYPYYLVLPHFLPLPFVLHLANVMHLATDVTGALLESHNVIDIFALLEKLHPSAAVCGTPTDIAKEIINKVKDENDDVPFLSLEEYEKQQKIVENFLKRNNLKKVLRLTY